MSTEVTLVRRQGEPGANFGMWDVKEKTWIGDMIGPFFYEDEMVARIAASITAVRLGLPCTQILGMAADGGPHRLQRTDVAKMTAEDAIRKIETGEIL